MSKSLATILFLAGSLVAVGLIVWLASALGFRGTRRIAGEDDVHALSARLGGARDFYIDADGTSFLALLHDGRLLAAKVMGNEIATRVLPKSAIASVEIYRPRRGRTLGLTLRFNDFSFPSIRIETMDDQPPVWLDDLREGATAT